MEIAVPAALRSVQLSLVGLNTIMSTVAAVWSVNDVFAEPEAQRDVKLPAKGSADAVADCAGILSM